MITKELLQQNEVLKGLTEEQMTAITTISANDENAVIGAKFSEVYQKLDSTIEKATGIKRNGDEKTYVYLERAATELKSQLKGTEELNAKIAELTSENSRLNTALKEGAGNEELKRNYEQSKKDFEAVTKQFNDLKKELDKEKALHTKDLFDLNVANEIGKATAGIKFKKDLPPSVTSVILEQAVNKVKGMNPDFIDDGKGGKMLAFKDEQGAIRRNAENKLNPFTASELISMELKQMGVLDEGREQKGAGSQPPTTGGGTSQVVDVSQARTRVEATDIITRQLLSQGLTNGSKEFDEKFQQVWKDSNVQNLPMN